jgi:hypothetical protein
MTAAAWGGFHHGGSVCKTLLIWESKVLNLRDFQAPLWKNLEQDIVKAESKIPQLLLAFMPASLKQMS